MQFFANPHNGRRSVMKKLMLTVALASIIASPGLAQSYDPDIGTGNIAAQIEAPAAQSNAQAAYARVPAGTAVRHVNRHRAAHAPYQAFGAVTPFGSPASATNASRDVAVRECSALAAPYRQTTWGNFEIHLYRTCMSQHSQAE
jgi:hypothetical protein